MKKSLDFGLFFIVLIKMEKIMKLLKLKYWLILGLLLFVSSCSSHRSPQIVTIAPPIFSFASIDPNNTDEKYATRMIKYDQILNTSPIPVFVMNVGKLDPRIPKRNGIKQDDKFLFGLYSHNEPIEGWPLDFIFINDKTTPEQMIVTYFHEVGHYHCTKKKCFCLKDTIMREQHAIIHELEMGWKYDCFLALESSIRMIGEYATSINEDLKMYHMASNNIIKTEIWKKTINHLIKMEKDND
jgi:hypothetical protein